MTEDERAAQAPKSAEVLRANVRNRSDEQVDAYAESVGGYQALLGTVFDGLRDRIVPAKDVAVGFSLEGAGPWSLGVANGAAFSERAIESVQATVRMSPRDFLRMIVREATGPELMSQRRMRIDGPPYAVSRLFSMIPGGVVTGAVEVEATFAAEPSRVWRALTGELADWFCEHADVDLDAGRYDFWGRYTLGAPTRADGGHKLLDVEIGRRIRFAWSLFGAETSLEFTLTPNAAATTLRVLHENVPMRNDGVGTRNFWDLALLNLRSWVELGRTPPLLDLSRDTHGGFSFSIDVDAPREAVFDDLYADQADRRTVGETWQVDVGVPVALELLRADAPTRLDHSWTPRGQTTSVVSWTLEDSGGVTRLTIVHSGMDPDYDAAGEMQGWFASGALQIKFRCERGRWDFTPHNVRVLQATTR